MCGRFVGAFSVEELVGELESGLKSLSLSLDAEQGVAGISPNWNTAPTQVAPVLKLEADRRVIVCPMRWGLVPSWSKDPAVGSKMINARSETITEKPSFKGLVLRHRCVVPMNGFYEWDRHDQKAKVPYFVPRADGHLMLVAGIWTVSPAVGGQRTFAIITRDSLADLAHIHDRSPVQLTSEDALEWLCEPQAPLHLLAEETPPPLAPRQVSTKVNSVRNNGPALIESVSTGNSQPDTLF